MAGRIGIARQTGITIAAAGTVTGIQLVPGTNHAIRILEVTVGSNGTNPTAEPMRCDILKQTTAGTMSALTLVNGDGGVSDTLDATAQHTASAEPTAGDVKHTERFHEQVGMRYQPVDGIMCAAGERVGVRIYNPTAASRDFDITVKFEE